MSGCKRQQTTRNLKPVGGGFLSTDLHEVGGFWVVGKIFLYSSDVVGENPHRLKKFRRL